MGLNNRAAWRAIGITLAALMVYRLGLQVPLPGINVSASDAHYSNAIAGFSLLAIGIMPWLGALKLFELASVLLPLRLAKRVTPDSHVSPFALPVLALALVLSFWQGYGVAIALGHVRGLVTTPDATFVWLSAFNMMVGTALVMALARIVERFGIGSGFWIMLAGVLLSNVPDQVTRAISFATQGAFSTKYLMLAFGSDVLIAIAVVTLLLARRRAGFTRAEPLVWPAMLSLTVVSTFALLTQLVLPQSLSIDEFLVEYTVPGFIADSVAISLIVARYAQRERSVGFALPTIILIISATRVLPSLLFNAPIQSPLGGIGTLILTTVCFVIYQRLTDPAGAPTT
jgi:hypothetical protein